MANYLDLQKKLTAVRITPHLSATYPHQSGL